MDGKISIKYADRLPDLEKSKADAAVECTKKRKAGMGFDYNWEYDRTTQEWNKVYNGKAIGTPCKSYLFGSRVSQTRWSRPELVDREGAIDDSDSDDDVEVALRPGLFDVTMNQWKLTKTLEDEHGYRDYEGDLGPYCSDPETYKWHVDDATHLI